MLYGWGANSHGQLGLGFASEQENLPRPVTSPEPLRYVTGGGGHTLAISDSGKLFACGWNQASQLGLGHLDNVDVFTDTGVTGVRKAAGGWDFSLVLLQDGRVLSSGSNKYWQCGAKDLRQNCQRFEEIPGLVDIVDVAAGLRHAAAVDKLGRVYTWGSATKGQLGRPCQDPLLLPGQVPHLTDIVGVACGQYFTLVNSRKGNLFGFGQNKFGEICSGGQKSYSLPQELNISGVFAISCGWTHSSAVIGAADNQAKKGETGPSNEGGGAVGGRGCDGVLQQTDDRNFLVWGRNNYHQCAQEEGACWPLDKSRQVLVGDLCLQKVICGSEHCMCLDKEGRVFAWGWNEHGNCGTGDTINVPRPTQISFNDSKNICDIFVGSAHCFALSMQ